MRADPRSALTDLFRQLDQGMGPVMQVIGSLPPAEADKMREAIKMGLAMRLTVFALGPAAALIEPRHIDSYALDVVTTLNEIAEDLNREH